MKKEDKILYAYLRVSTQQQVDKELSIPEQRQLAKKKAKELGFKLVVYEELGESASHSDLDNRPQLFEILKHVEEGKCKHLFVWEQSRLSRNDQTKSLIRFKLKKHKVILYTPAKHFDLSSLEDTLTYQILDVIEEYDSGMRKARFALGYASANRQGRFLKIIPPFGYTKDEDDKLVIDEEEKEVLLRIFDWYEEGLGTNRIADRLNEQKEPTKTSKILKDGYTLSAGKANRKKTEHIKKNKWNSGTILSMLKNTVYYGKRKFALGGGEYDYVDCDPIISKERWDKLQSIRKSNAVSKRRVNKYFYLLKGLLVCGTCGRPMHGRIKPSREEYSYRCNSKRSASNCGTRGIRISKLDALVWDIFKRSKHYHKLINHLLLPALEDDALADTLKEIQQELSHQIHRQEVLEKRLKDLVKEKLDSEIDEKVYLELKKEIETELEQARISGQTLKQEESFMQSQIASVTQTKEQIEKGRLLFNQSVEKIDALFPFDTKDKQHQVRAILLGCIDRIVVHYDKRLKKYIVDVMFKDVGVKKGKQVESPETGELEYQFADESPYRFEPHPPVMVQLGLREEVDTSGGDPLQLNWVDEEQATKLREKSEMAYSELTSTEGTYPKKINSNSLPPLSIRQHLSHYRKGWYVWIRFIVE